VRAAYYSPLPPERSGIADYSAQLIPALGRRVGLHVVPPGARRPPRHVDIDLYHVGNNADSHGWIVDALRRRPGVVVLHEFVLHHLVAGMTLGRGDAEGYLSAMQREAGSVGRLLAHGVVDGLIQPLWEHRPEDFPLAQEVLGDAVALVVHSRYVEARVRETGYEGRIWRLPMPAWSDPPVGERRLPGDRFPIVGSFGYLNFTRRIPQLLDAFAELRERFPSALLVLGGAASPRFEIEDRLLPLQREGALLRMHHLPEETLWQLLADCDLVVSLRHPTMGETSAMALRALSVGTPLVASDAGWFSELPDGVVLKVPPGDGEAEVLAEALERLADESQLRARMSRAALRIAREEHSLERVADLYAEALEETAGGPPARAAVVAEVAAAADEVGLDPDGEELAGVAARMREVGLGG
jgi:glycosyltransferase involved in cell wall biosynthesis